VLRYGIRAEQADLVLTASAAAAAAAAAAALSAAAAADHSTLTITVVPSVASAPSDSFTLERSPAVLLVTSDSSIQHPQESDIIRFVVNPMQRRLGGRRGGTRPLDMPVTLLRDSVGADDPNVARRACEALCDALGPSCTTSGVNSRLAWMAPAPSEVSSAVRALADVLQAHANDAGVVLAACRGLGLAAAQKKGKVAGGMGALASSGASLARGLVSALGLCGGSPSLMEAVGGALTLVAASAQGAAAIVDA
jgi:hypothetical protein